MPSGAHNGTIDVIGLENRLDLLIATFGTHAADNYLVLCLVILSILQHHDPLIANTGRLCHLRGRMISTSQDGLCRRNTLTQLGYIFAIINGNSMSCPNELRQTVVQSMVRKGSIAYLFSTHIFCLRRETKNLSHRFGFLTVGLIKVLVSDEDDGIWVLVLLFLDIGKGCICSQFFGSILVEVFDMLTLITNQGSIVFHLVGGHHGLIDIVYMKALSSGMNGIIALFRFAQFLILIP